jgi:predicted phosphodiesterase
MKELKIGIISDEHLDFYIKANSNHLERDINKYIKTVLKPEKGDILLCTGDISHYNNMTKIYLKKMTEYYNNVVFVHGNHDLYLVSESQKKKYNKQSFNRLAELREFSDNERCIHFLEGSVISINGLEIGGLANWYNLPTPGLIAQWKEVMNDSNLIMEGSEPNHISYGYGAYEKIPSFDTQKFREEIEKQWDNLKNSGGCDILLTHICPIIIPDEHLLSCHVGSKNNIFYMTDDIQRVKDTECSIVVYGHNHQIKEWTLEDIEFKTNAIGYPMEYVGNGIKHFKITLM